MATDIGGMIVYLESRGYQVINWKPGYRRIYKVLSPLESGRADSQGMYAGEFRAWFKGYLEGGRADG